MFKFYKIINKNLYFLINLNINNILISDITYIKKKILINFQKSCFIINKIFIKIKLFYSIIYIYLFNKNYNKWYNIKFLTKININFVKNFLILNFLNIPIFNIFIKNNLFSKIIFIKLINNFNILYYLIDFLKFNLYYIINNKNIFVKNIFIIYKSIIYFINEKNLIKKKYKFSLDQKKIKINCNFNKFLYKNYNNTIFIKKNIKNDLFFTNKLKILKIYIKKWLIYNFNKFSKNYKLIPIFDLFGKIIHYILLDIKLNKEFLKQFFIKLSFIYKKNNFSLLKLYFINISYIIFENFGSYLDYINIISDIKIIKINNLFFLNIINYKLNWINKTLYNKNENLLILKYNLNVKFICKFYDVYYMLLIICNFDKIILLNNNLLDVKKKFLNVVRFFIYTKYNCNLYWLIYNLYLKLLKIYLFSVKIYKIYNFFIKKVTNYLKNYYKINIVKSYLIYKSMSYNFTFKKFKILNDFYKLNFFVKLKIINYRIYKLIKVFFYDKNKIKKFYFVSFYEKKIYNILNKIIFNSNFFIFIINKTNLYIFDVLYIYKYINIFLNNIKINFSLNVIHLNRVWIILQLYKVFNIDFYLLSI